MYVQEVDILTQIYELIGIDPSPELNIIVVFISGIVLCMLVNNTIGMFFKGLLGGYER